VGLPLPARSSGVSLPPLPPGAGRAAGLAAGLAGAVAVAAAAAGASAAGASAAGASPAGAAAAGSADAWAPAWSEPRLAPRALRMATDLALARAVRSDSPAAIRRS
jgi:hypothetical protein